MAEILDPSALKRSVGRARVEYPWGEWADGQTRQVEQGKDFACSAKSFRSVLSKYGAQNGLKAVIGTPDESAPDVVIFRFELRPEGYVAKKRARKAPVTADGALVEIPAEIENSEIEAVEPEALADVVEAAALTGVVEAPAVTADGEAMDW